ncbi:hypothetical protein [Bacillus wiedmannii]|uniref:hypothetical protein n=1 Tax=Bacillus wiedmannii TaxID=1890302 RepID=UPI000BEFAB76|nr:hypothetical protein [Bacillus wiedmannii]PEM44513.1 hypothetical protein CN618_28995 [Bacillus wiedmannii]PEU18919.1 hypothetical protein CN526_30140 [Bacillus wiedmannii]PHC80598.1 hypothetical protein COF42_29660 [Bacillus wiedmannii]
MDIQFLIIKHKLFIFWGIDFEFGNHALENYRDGFNYHEDSWNTSYFFEINNKCQRDGLSVDVNYNNKGSTSHVNCIGIRINGLHFENKGPNVSDVDSRNLSWNVGCTAYNFRMTPTTIDFLIENPMWLESCTAYG